MRTVLTMLLAASLLQAQTKAIPDQGPPPKNLTAKADGHFSANGDPANPEKFEVYLVKAGDTLSMVAAQVMKNARLWPQLWEQNDQIINPHWIYPNDKILIKPVTVITEAAAPPAPEEPPAAEPEPQPKRVVSPVIASRQTVQPAPPRTAVFDYRPRRNAPEIKQTDLYCSGFIRNVPISTDLRVSAKYNSDNGAMAQQGDYVYISRSREDSMQPGDRFEVVRPTRHLEGVGGSRAKRDLGMHYLDIAQIEVISAQPDFALTHVSTICDTVELGDILIPFQRQDVPTIPQGRPFNPFMQAAGGIAGSVVITKNVLLNFGSTFRASGIIPHSDAPELAPLEGGIAGPGDIVYVDIGRNSGVKSGDVFIVYRPIDVDTSLYSLPADAKGVKHAQAAVGEVVILKVDERASSALVTYSSVGVSAGDSVARR